MIQRLRTGLCKRRFFSTSSDHTELKELLSTLKDQKPTSELCSKALNLCNKLGCIQEGKWIHSLIMDNRLQIETHVGNTLISLYSKFGEISEAAQVYDSITNRNVITWTVMISAYAEKGQFFRAFNLFRGLSLEGLKLDLCALRVLLTLCAKSGALNEGRLLHSEVREKETDLIIGNLLINMYGKCSCIEEARAVFLRMPELNVVSWTSMISGFALSGKYPEALRIYREMLLEGSPSPNPVTFVVALDACERASDATSLHSQALERGCVDLLVATTLVDVLGKCGAPDEARGVFDGIPGDERTTVSWTTMISAYVESDEIQKALGVYRMMQLEGVKPALVTFVTLIGKVSPGDQVSELGFLEDHVVESGFGGVAFAGNAFIAMHARLENLVKAREAFDRIREKDMISWNTMLSAYAQGGASLQTFELLRLLRLEGLGVTDYTLIAGLTACSREEFLREGELLHSHVKQSGFEKETLHAALVSMYGRCGKLSVAEELFNRLETRGNERIPLWNSLIILLVQRGEVAKALKLFRRMKLEGVRPDPVTYTSVLNACSNRVDIVHGKQIHLEISECGRGSTSSPDPAVGNALLDLHAKCGHLGEAEGIFNRMGVKNLISWTSMLAMYAQHGHPKLCLKSFFRMQQDGVRPNQVTITAVLFACSHGGLLEEGYECFAKLRSDFNLAPSPDHFTCMVDLLGRSGRVEEAEELLNRFPNVRATRLSLLSSCRKLGEIDRAKRAACGEAVQSDSSMYVMLSQVLC